MRTESVVPASLQLLRAALLAIGGLGLAAVPAIAGTQPAIVIDVFNTNFGNATTGQHVDPTITVGQTVRWHWAGGLHSSTSVLGIAESWDSGDNDTGFDFDHTFTNVGAFPYYCDLHGFDAGNGTAGGMSGIVHVSAPEPSMTLLGGVAGAALLGLRRRTRCAPRR
jgi:plastocyanin